MKRSCQRSVPSSEAVLLAAVLGLPGVGMASPVGPEVIQGSAGFVTAGPVLTVTPSANTVIQWRGFNIAPGETVRFVQPAGSSVLNRVPEGAPQTGGALESAGRVLFLTGSSVSGAGLQLDLARSVDSSLRLPVLPATRRGVARPESGERSVMLTGDRVFVIGAGSVARGASGRVLLAPGTSAELGQLSLPHVRVFVAAPAAAPLDLDALVTRRPGIGIFNALFAPRPGPRSEQPATALATAGSPSVATPMVIASGVPVEERTASPVPVVLAPVEERAALALAAPVEERLATLLPVAQAPVEDRAGRVLASDIPEAGAMKLAAAGPADPVVAENDAGKPEDAPSALMRVAAALPPVAAPVASAMPQAAVRLPEVRRRMPRIMVDHKGAVFHL